MAISELAGKKAPKSMLVNITKLIDDYYEVKPDLSNASCLVSFGTSGHRGSSTKGSFNEGHILAITQAICDYRNLNGINGPLYMGKDTHALSEPAQKTALEVLSANGINVFIQENDGYTPTPVISLSILTYNNERASCFADGIVITPSHNPPEDGGIKYNPPDGGPADTSVTKWIEDRANSIFKSNNAEVKRFAYKEALKAPTTHLHDFVKGYVDELKNIIDFDVIKSSGISIGADPLGGSGVFYWEPIKEKYGININVLNPDVDKTFSFMPVDHDGKIRMDCSSPYAMANLVDLKDKFNIAFGNDTDFDRHGIVTPSVGLMNPNHFLSVAIWYLFQNREMWPKGAKVGKTLVSSSMIDRVSAHINREVCEVPVGFKWFVKGLIDGSFGFGGEESAGASFLRMNGKVWTTDKDGIIMDLLAAEITSRTGKDPGLHFQHLVELFGEPFYKRVDIAANSAQRSVLKRLSPENVDAVTLAGEPILAKITKAPGNGADIGGIKVTAKNGWFAARPSGTEDINKIYAESFKSKEHLEQILKEAYSIAESAYKTALVKGVNS